jgi:hypothetical protein
MYTVIQRVLKRPPVSDSDMVYETLLELLEMYIIIGLGPIRVNFGEGAAGARTTTSEQEEYPLHSY